MTEAQTLAALAAILVLVLWFAKQGFNKTLEDVRRIPPKEWFDEVKEAVDRVPEAEWFRTVGAKLEQIDPKRIQEHYDRVHKLSNIAWEAKLKTDEHKATLNDHETRIRTVEKRG